MFSRRLVVIILMIISSSSVFAAKNAWRQCGIGAMIFPRTGWAAVTSNIIWDYGITATSSSSSSESQCAGRASTAAKFIHQNYALLEEETSIGQGDHIVTVLNILDCKKNSHDKIIQTIRANMNETIKSDVPADESYYNNMMNVIESGYKTQCQLT